MEAGMKWRALVKKKEREQKKAERRGQDQKKNQGQEQGGDGASEKSLPQTKLPNLFPRREAAEPGASSA